MDNTERLAVLLRKALHVSPHDDLLGPLTGIGESTPRRAETALDILSKAIDRSKLVRVQRTVIRNGKSMITHLWVTPDKVKKNDVILQNKNAYEQWKKTDGKDAEQAGQGKLTNNPMKKLGSKKKGAGSVQPKPKPSQESSEGSTSPAKDKTEKQYISDSELRQIMKKGDPSLLKLTLIAKKLTLTDEQQAKVEAWEAETKLSKPTKTKTQRQSNKASGGGRQQAPDVIESWNCDQMLAYEAYQAAGLKKSDNLASEASFNAAVGALQGIQSAGAAHVKAAAAKVLEEMIIQHMTALHGKEEMEAAAAAYKGTEAAKHHSPELIASAVMAWQSEGSAAIRARSLDHDADADPVSNLYSKSLMDMITHSSTVQSSTLYRGIHVRQDFLRQALENGTISTKGLISASANEASARRRALRTDSGEVGVVLELPQSLKHKTLELGSETLLSMGVKFASTLTVKRVTKDEDGIYHVQLAPKGTKLDGPVADDDIYAALGAQKPGEAHRKLPDVEGSQIDANAYKQIMAYITDKSKDTYGRYEVIDALQKVYARYGRDGAVAVLTEYARAAIKENSWTEKYASSKTGYDPKLMEMVHDDWIHAAYSYIRKMENADVDEDSHGCDVYHKICNDVLHSIVEKDGQEQPSMLYRGMKPYGEGMQAYLHSDVGEEIKLGGISSFSATASIAGNFAGPSGIVLKLPMSTKTRCAYVAGLGKENEYIVPDAAFRVTKREEKSGRVYLTLEPA